MTLSEPLRQPAARNTVTVPNATFRFAEPKIFRVERMEDRAASQHIHQMSSFIARALPGGNRLEAKNFTPCRSRCRHATMMCAWTWRFAPDC